MAETLMPRQHIEVEQYGTVTVDGGIDTNLVTLFLSSMKRATVEEPGLWLIELNRKEALNLIAAIAYAMNQAV